MYKLARFQIKHIIVSRKKNQIKKSQGGKSIPFPSSFQIG